eukprot:1060644-Amorphochlora_amoeboformis.AAC.2
MEITSLFAPIAQSALFALIGYVAYLVLIPILFPVRRPPSKAPWNGGNFSRDYARGTGAVNL